VVFFGPGLDEPGGMAKRTRLMARSLAERGWEVRVISRSGTHTRFRVTREGRVRALDIPGFNLQRAGSLLYLAVAPLAGVWWGWRSDSFMAVQLKSTAIVAALLGWLLRRPYVALTTSTGDLSEVAYVSSGTLAPLRRRLLARAFSLVAQSKSGAYELRQIVAAEHVAVVPTPVAIPSRIPPLDGRPRVAFSGRFSTEKDLPRLLEVWERIGAKVPDACLTLVGSGGAYRSVEQDLKTRVAQSATLRRCVIFTGWVDEQEVARQVASSDIYVFPSLSEGMSNALLEACALGRVVVASDIPANVAVLGSEYPLLHQPGETDDLERAMRLALENQTVRAKARSMALAAAARCSIERVTDSLERLLYEAADRARHK